MPQDAMNGSHVEVQQLLLERGGEVLQEGRRLCGLHQQRWDRMVRPSTTPELMRASWTCKDIRCCRMVLTCNMTVTGECSIC